MKITLYAAILLFSLLVAVIAIFVTRRYREHAGGRGIFWFLLMLSGWLVSGFLEEALLYQPLKIFFGQLVYVFVAFSPLMMFYAVITYTHKQKYLNWFLHFLLWVIPIIISLLSLTNDYHHLMWTGIISKQHPFTQGFSYIRGPAFWFLVAYAYIILFLAILILLVSAYRFRFLYRRQILILFIAIPFPWVINIIYVFNLFPGFSVMDPTPISFMFTCLILLWGIKNLLLFDLSPFAREMIVDHLKSLMMVLDQKHRLIDANQTMLDFMEKINPKIRFRHLPDLIGIPAENLFQNNQAFMTMLNDLKSAKNELTLELNGQTYIYDVFIEPIYDQSHLLSGWVINLDDITDREKTIRLEKRSREIAEVMHEIALVVNSSLDVKQTLNLAMEQISRVINFDTANIALLFDNEFRIEFVRGFPNPDEIVGLWIPLDGSPNQQALIHRHPVMYSDVKAVFEKYRDAPHNVINSLLCIPMYAKKEVIGFLTLDGYNYDHFKPEDVTVADAFASQVAIALHNASLYADARRNYEEQSILNEIIRIASTKLDKKSFIESTINQIKRFINTQEIYFAEYEPGSDTWTIFLFTSPGNYVTKNHLLKQGMIGYVLQTREALFLKTKVEVLEFLDQNQRDNYGTIPFSFMCVPMIFQDKVIGAIASQDITRENAFSEHDFKLFSTITSQISIAYENVNLFSRMEKLAVTDGLTGLFNRRYFFQLALKVFEDCQVRGQEISAIMLDIDDFKEINDTKGHLIGDQVLMQVAKTCRGSLREIDIICRYGGEEFAILLPNTKLDLAAQVAERIRNAVDGLLVNTEKGVVTTTISLGVASCNQPESTLERLLDFSDQALYQAKAAGKNSVKQYDPTVS